MELSAAAVCSLRTDGYWRTFCHWFALWYLEAFYFHGFLTEALSKVN